MDDRTLVSLVRARIAQSIVYVFLGVTVLLILAVVFGLMDQDEAMEGLRVWSATYSLLVGAVIGYYFGIANNKDSG